jgi:hypothetical protein
MFVAFMPLQIFLCDEVLPYFISCVESRSRFKLVLNSNGSAIREKGLKIKREFLMSKTVLGQEPRTGPFPIRVARPSTTSKPAWPLEGAAHVAA